MTNQRKHKHLRLPTPAKVARTTDEVRNRWAEELKQINIARSELYPSKLSEEEVNEINSLLRRGFSVEAVMVRTGRSKGTVVRYKQILLEKGEKLQTPPPPYERQPIDYEAETELPLLSNRWDWFSLDELCDEDGDEDWYSRISAQSMTPLGILIWREEKHEAIRRVEEIERYDQFLQAA